MSCATTGATLSYNGGAFVTYNSGDTYQDPTNIITGYYSDVDSLVASRMPSGKVAIKITHVGVATGNYFNIFNITPLLTEHGNRYIGFQADVDRSCGERLAMKLTHGASSSFQVNSIRVQANMRHYRQPAGKPG